MPPRAPLALPEIPGEVLRSYRVHDVADIDRYLRGLKTWLAASVARAPEFSADYLARYNSDVDALLDARVALEQLAYAT